MGSINALPSYTNYFDLPSSGNASTGIVFAIFQAGPCHPISILPSQEMMVLIPDAARSAK